MTNLADKPDEGLTKLCKITYAAVRPLKFCSDLQGSHLLRCLLSHVLLTHFRARAQAPAGGTTYGPGVRLFTIHKNVS
jgi:hypothetical protein